MNRLPRLAATATVAMLRPRRSTSRARLENSRPAEAGIVCTAPTADQAAALLGDRPAPHGDVGLAVLRDESAPEHPMRDVGEPGGFTDLGDDLPTPS